MTVATVRVATGLAAVLAAACRGPIPAARHHLVDIESLTFVPARLVVTAGDTISWTNRDIVPHTVTGPDSRWDSGYLASGASFTLVVQPGDTGSYLCVYHPTMTGRLEMK